MAASVASSIQGGGARSEWVYVGSDGRLAYKATLAGDRIMDFSFAGYMGGGVALPDVPVVITLKPSGGKDDSALIQGAINRVSAMPMRGMFRGAVLLEPGTFNCSTTLNIAADGVVLRGSGCGPTGAISTINLTGRPHLAISVRKAGSSRSHREIESEPEDSGSSSRSGLRTLISDAYVPSGSSSFHVADAGHFAVGDWIEIRRPVTEKWVSFMQMDDLVRDGRQQTWIRTGGSIVAQRRIAAISESAITVDVPLSDSFDSRYLNPPGTSVGKIPPPSEVAQAGLESLHIQCEGQHFNHDQAHFNAIRMDGQDCWIRDLIADETMDSIGVNGRRITLEHVSVNRKTEHVGASKPAEFAPNGTQVLMDRCSVTADNVWFCATGAEISGPIVLLNCTFNGASEAESHQRWSTGILYDNCKALGGGITIRNRGSMGSGHGWTMGWGVIWNCQAKEYIVQNPPGAVNWEIGCSGVNNAAASPFGSAPILPGGMIDSYGRAVGPGSLYLAQLRERLGETALKKIGY
jgi:hypothetical protein